MNAYALKLKLRWLFTYQLKRWLDRQLGGAILPLLHLIERIDRVRASNAVAALMRRIGPRMREHKIGRANLTAAFPDKSADEIEQILVGVWDNLGRVAVEFAHLRHLLDVDEQGHHRFLTYDQADLDRFERLRAAGKPALVFTAHLANWELPAVVGGLMGVRTAVLYRPPNLRSFADAVIAVREPLMGVMVPSGFDAPFRLARGLEENRVVGMLVDQHDSKGIEATFFRRRCRVSPLIAKLAREYDCPIHGVRMIRLPDGRFRGEITEPVPPVRDADGRIDVAGTMQAITNVVEGWVREHPEQWLWLHRRWR